MMGMTVYISILCMSLIYMKIEKIRNGEIVQWIRNAEV